MILIIKYDRVVCFQVYIDP